VVDCRLVLDKFTRQPRGFAFVEFRSIAEAGAAMQACQGAAPAGQEGGVRICYARAKDAEGGGSAAAAAAGGGGVDAGAGGEVAAAPSREDPFAGWAPKEFDEHGVVVDNAEQQQAAADHHHHHHQQQQQQQQAEGDQSEGGFQYDPSSGLYYESSSGYYYDSSTGLYYHPSAPNTWLRLEGATGEFAPVEAAGGEHRVHDHHQQHAQEGEIGPQVGPQVAPQQPQQQQQQQQQHPAQRRTATIGAAPQLNAQGLLTMVAVEEVRMWGLGSCVLVWSTGVWAF